MAAERKEMPGAHTLEEYYTLAESQRVELIDGTFYQIPAPSFAHQEAVGEIYWQLRDLICKEELDCRVFMAPLDVRLDETATMVQPDVFLVCDRGKVRTWGIVGPPDFVLEVLSCSTSRKDCIIKLQKYADAGVKEYWLLDPEEERLLTYDLREDAAPLFRCYGLEGEADIRVDTQKLRIDLGRLKQALAADM